MNEGQQRLPRLREPHVVQLYYYAISINSRAISNSVSASQPP